MGTGSIFRSDLYKIHGIIQNTMISFPKELLIETLRDEFKNDSYYHYVKDEWGFPKTPNLTDVPIDAGLQDDVTTRLFIGEASRFDKKFYPAILVRSGGFKYAPISMSQDDGFIKHTAVRVLDGYNNERIYSIPSYMSFSGAWEGQLSVDILAGDSQARDELTEIVSALLTTINFNSLANSGVVFKPVSIGSPSESEDGKGKIYKQTISCDIRTEWNKIVPLDTTIDTITFCADFGNLESNDPVFADNIQVSTILEIIDDLS